jgi:hypothetical protein
MNHQHFSMWDVVVTTIGVESAAKISQIYRGGKIYVPASLTAAKKLIEIVGEDDAERVVDALGGCHVAVPVQVSSMRAARDLEIIESYKSGALIDSIARQYNMTARNVHLIIKRGSSCSH